MFLVSLKIFSFQIFANFTSHNSGGCVCSMRAVGKGGGLKKERKFGRNNRMWNQKTGKTDTRVDFFQDKSNSRGDSKS